MSRYARHNPDEPVQHDWHEGAVRKDVGSFKPVTDEQREALESNTRRINAMPEEELRELVMSGRCPREPEHLVGVPLGMFHCEVCGLMVLAGLPHLPYKWVGDWKTGFADFEIADENRTLVCQDCPKEGCEYRGDPYNTSRPCLWEK